MCLTGCSKPADPGSDPSGSATAKDAVHPCASCTITVSPKTLKICGASKTVTVTATGSPAGGSFAWESSDTAVATVSATGGTATVTGVGAGSATIKATYTPPGCSACSDTASLKVCTCTAGRKYAYAYKSVAKLTGAKAKIKTRYGKLCCEDLGCTDGAYNVIFISVAADSGGSHWWAQAGYGRERTAGSAAIKKYRYAEMQGSTYKVKYDAPNAPAEGSVHAYQIELEKSTGTWTYSFDGSAWQTFADNGWKGTPGDTAKCVSEIFNTEDDMAGTAADKCSFTEWQHRIEGKGYKDAGLTSSDIVNNDTSEWGAEQVSSTAFNLWDKKPLP